MERRASQSSQMVEEEDLPILDAREFPTIDLEKEKNKKLRSFYTGQNALVQSFVTLQQLQRFDKLTPLVDEDDRKATIAIYLSFGVNVRIRFLLKNEKF